MFTRRYNCTPGCTAKNVFVVRSTKGLNNIDCYRHVVQVFLGLGWDIYALNPHDTCTGSCESGPIYYIPRGKLNEPRKVKVCHLS